MNNEVTSQDRLDAWVDGGAICVIAVSSHGDPLDLSSEEVEAFVRKLMECVREEAGAADKSRGAS